MIYNLDSAITLTKSLIQVKAVKLNPAHPFTWASGWKSPIYCDTRITLSYPKVRTFIRQQFTKCVIEKYGDVDLIAGVATGAIAHGVLVAQELGVPFVYVRSSEKSHGMKNLIEGHLESGQSVVVIEDLVSTGGSSLNACKAIRENGGVVKGLISIFNYGFQEAADVFKFAGIEVFSLSDYSTLIEEALNQDIIQNSELDILLQWRSNPSEWGRQFS